VAGRWLRAALALVLLASSGVGAGSAGAQQIGAPPPPLPEITPVPLDFGSVQVGFSALGTLTIRNPTASNDLSFQFGSPTQPAFALAATTCTRLPGGQSCTVSLRFAPPQATSFSATLPVTYVYRQGGGRRIDVPLVGAGTAAPPRTTTTTTTTTTTVPAPVAPVPRPSLAVTPSVADFGAIAVGTTRDVGFTVTNNGNVALTPLAPTITITGAQATDFAVTGSSCGPLGPGASCIVGTRFTPTANGVRSSTLVASYRATTTATDVRATAQLAGTGTVAPVLGLTVTPSQATYPETLIGEVAPAQALTVRNTGNQPETIASVTVTGPNAAEFPLTGGCTSATLAPGATCDVTVAFQPTDIGARTASLDVRGASGTPALGQLTGTGARVGLAIEPPTPDLGTAPVGSATATLPLVVRNVGTRPLTLDAPAIDGSAEFAITATNCGGRLLGPLETCTVSVVATPTDAGPRQAVLLASSGDVRAVANLTATGALAPQLRMEPPVGPAGVVTAAVGSGFPRNTEIRVGWFGSTSLVPVTTDDAGSWRLPVLVLRNERRGPRTMLVEDQPGRFSGVQAPYTVTAPTFDPSGLPALGGRVRLVSRG
jgi:hypothetical protein